MTAPVERVGRSDSPPTQPAATKGLPPGQLGWAVAAWYAGMGASLIDSNMASVALPVIAHDLGATSAASIWVLSASQIAAAVCILPASSLSDSLGFKRVFLAGVFTLMLGSVVSALAPNLPALILARILSGAASGCIFSLMGAFISAAYPPERVGRGLTQNTAAISLCIAAAPAVAAGLLAVTNWRGMFLVTVPASALALAIGWRYLPAAPRRKHHWDGPSTALNAAFFTLFILGLQTFAHGGSPLAWAAIAAAVLAATLFVRRQLRSPAPILALDLLAIPRVSMSVITMMFCFVAQTAMLVSLPFFLYRHTSSGALLMSCWPLGSLMVAPLTARLGDRYSVGLLGAAGMTAFSLGALSLALTPVDAAPWDLAWRVGLCGAGFGFFGPPNYRGVLASTPRERAGAAGGLIAAFRTLAQSGGGAFAAVLFGLVGAGAANARSLDAVFYSAAGLAAAGSALCLSRRKL